VKRTGEVVRKNTVEAVRKNKEAAQGSAASSFLSYGRWTVWISLSELRVPQLRRAAAQASKLRIRDRTTIGEQALVCS